MIISQQQSHAFQQVHSHLSQVKALDHIGLWIEDVQGVVDRGTWCVASSLGTVCNEDKFGRSSVCVNEVPAESKLLWYPEVGTGCSGISWQLRPLCRHAPHPGLFASQRVFARIQGRHDFRRGGKGLFLRFRQ